jgi:hypothetical protein
VILVYIQLLSTAGCRQQYTKFILSFEFFDKEGWVAKFLAHPLARAALRVRTQTFIKKGINKGVASTLWYAKNKKRIYQ